MKKFLKNEIWVLTITAAFQRARIYKSHALEEEKSRFRAETKKYINDLVQRSYLVDCDDESHYRNLQSLSDWSKGFGSILKGGKLNLGVSQKLLNLYLKYRWCLGNIPIPPHCPFDSRIINKLEKSVRVNWTQLNDIKQYKNLVYAATKQANEKSLAEWELQEFNRR